MNSYDMSRQWFDFAFDNPEKISPNHAAIYFFAIEHCNRLGWKEKFGFPTQMVMDAVGIKKHQTYIPYFQDLVDWGFFKLIEKSKNQYSANIISICCQNASTKKDKALDKAIIKHAAKQGASNGQSNSSIDKQVNKETNKQTTIPTWAEFLEYAISLKPTVNQLDLRLKYESWIQNDWKTSGENSRQIGTKWKVVLANTLPHLKETAIKPRSSIFNQPMN